MTLAGGFAAFIAEMKTHKSPQRIPRPPVVRPGDAAPWANLPAAERRIDLGTLRLAMQGWPAAPQAQGVSQRLSAVLIPLYEHRGQLHLILTRRAAHLRAHSRDVAFPGGGREPTDANLWETALRETREEIGLDPAAAVCIGELDRFSTLSSGSLVHSYVAELPSGRPGGLRPDTAEVEKIIHLPLSRLLAPEVYRQEVWHSPGHIRHINFFDIPGDTIWGATATILRQLLVIATGVWQGGN